MSVILDAHVSRSNTSGSVPPMLVLGLLIWHVVAAQSAAHVKVYVPTLKRSTARRCADNTRAYSGPGQPAAADRCGGVRAHAAAADTAGNGHGAPGAAVGVAVASNDLCAACT